MAGLAVNVDHIATLRQARGRIPYPDPAAAAVLAELAGADGIVVHLREDRRHIQDRDVRVLRNTVQTKLILEMAAIPEMVGIALDIRPDVVTLVPEKREELTTEGGLDLVLQKNNITDTVATLRSGGIPVSLFVDPDIEQIKLAHRTSADIVELHAGGYCDASGPVKRQQAFDRMVEAARFARKLKLGVHAGHGLSYTNIKAFRGVPEIQEFSIGHSIVARAAMVGMEKAVRDMIALIRE